MAPRLATCFWQVGSSATLGSDSNFVGTILAHQSITVTTNVTILGRVLAENGAVTLDSDNNHAVELCNDVDVDDHSSDLDRDAYGNHRAGTVTVTTTVGSAKSATTTEKKARQLRLATTQLESRNLQLYHPPTPRPRQ